MNRAMKIQTTCSSSVNKLRRFLRQDEGAITVEFALVLPIFLSLMVLFSVSAQANLFSSQVAHTAATVSDIISQSETMSAGEVDAALAAGDAIAGTQTAGAVKLTVVGVQVKNNGSTEVKWSRAINGGALPAKGSTYPLPASLTAEPGYIIVSKAVMDYVPAVGHAITGTIPLSTTNYFIPRVGFAASCTDCN